MIRFTFVLLCITTIGFAQSPDEAAIRKNRQDSNTAIANKDSNTIGSFFLEDFVLVRGNGVQVVGKTANIAVWSSIFKGRPQTTFVRTPNEVIIGVQKDMAWENGTWEGVNAYSKGGKYAAMWRKVNGSWKLQAELFVALN